MEDPEAVDEPAVASEGVPSEVEAGPSGDGIVILDWVGTGVFFAVATLATLLPDDVARTAAVVDIVLFGVGVVAFLWAYGIAISRSRTDRLSIAGLYFLVDDAAPRDVRIRLRIALAVQIVVAIVSASIRLYTSVAFGVLVPMFGLGLMGLWGARYGRFPARDDGEA